jgi:hypothetical protein
MIRQFSAGDAPRLAQIYREAVRVTAIGAYGPPLILHECLAMANCIRSSACLQHATRISMDGRRIE